MTRAERCTASAVRVVVDFGEGLGAGVWAWRRGAQAVRRRAIRTEARIGLASSIDAACREAALDLQRQVVAPSNDAMPLQIPAMGSVGRNDVVFRVAGDGSFVERIEPAKPLSPLDLSHQCD